MRLRVLVVAAVITSLSTAIFATAIAPPRVLADDNTTFCKWPLDGPSEVWYYVNDGAGQFSDDLYGSADRVMYGGNTWSEGGFNLIFHNTDNRDHSTNYSEHFKGYIANLGHIAVTNQSPSPNCNVDEADPLTRVVTTWNDRLQFHDDCNLVGTGWCEDNSMYDIHHISTHEFGHWFRMTHSTDASATMYCCTDYGEIHWRSIEWDDKESGRIMYGCRSGYSCGGS